MLLLLLAIAGCGGGTSDKAACGTFYQTLDSTASYQAKLAGWRSAASQAQSQSLRSALNAVANNWANSSSGFTLLGERALADCIALGYRDPSP